MIGYVTLLFMLVSTVSFFMAPMTFSRPFCVWEMITFLLASFFFLQHKIRRNGIICFDTFFIPSFFLINYCHAVFIFPDDKFLPPFLFPTNTDLISYALAVAQLGISFYMLGNVFFEKEVPEHRRMKIDIPEMAVNRAAVVALVASFSVFCYVIVLRMAASFQHLYPRLMAMIVALIVLSWFFQAQHLEPGDDSPKGLLRKNKLNILSTALFSISQLFVGSRGVVLFLVFMLLLVINTFYFKIRFKVLLPAILIGILGMAILGITRVSSYSVASADFGDMVKYGFEVVMESPNILWLLLTDFVVNAKTLYDSVDYVQLHGYMMGKSYIQYLFVFLPMGGTFFTKLLTGLDMDEVSTGVILTVFSDATYGLGTNMVGDLYMNFSYIGVLVMMFLLGILVAMVEFPETKYQFYVALALFAECIFLVRADIFTWITFFVFFLIFDWIMRIHIHYAENTSD
jgi:hypothetical protein